MTKPYRRLEPACREAFYVERRTAHLTRTEAAAFLGVTVRTIRNWENGTARIPYSAFKLLRMCAGAIVHVKGWDGWRFGTDGALFSPCGRSFQSAQMIDMRLTFSMAQHFRDMYNKPRPQIDRRNVRSRACCSDIATGQRG